MLTLFKNRLISLLRWSERYTKTDMVYLAGSGLWMSLGTAVLSFAALLLYIVLANTLTPEQYGVYQYLLSAGAIMGAFTLTGMNTAVARAVAQQYEGTLKRAVQTQLAFGFIPFLIGLSIALYYMWQSNYLLALGFTIIGIFVPFLNAFNTYGAYLHGKSDFRRGFWYGLIWNIPFYVAVILTAFTFPFALVLLFVNFFVQTLATGYLYQRVLKTQVRNQNVDEDAITYGKHLSVMNVPGLVANQIDAILAFHYLGAAPLAIYSFATAIPERIAGLFKFLPTAALPKFSGKTSVEIRSALFSGRLWIMVSGVLIAVCIYALLSPLLFTLLFPAYESAVPFSQWYGLIFFSVIGNLFVVGLTAQRSVKELYVYNVASPTFQILLQFGGVLLYGLWGLIIGRLLATFCSLLLAVALLFKTPSS